MPAPWTQSDERHRCAFAFPPLEFWNSGKRLPMSGAVATNVRQPAAFSARTRRQPLLLVGHHSSQPTAAPCSRDRSRSSDHHHPRRAVPASSTLSPDSSPPLVRRRERSQSPSAGWCRAVEARADTQLSLSREPATAPGCRSRRGRTHPRVARRSRQSPGRPGVGWF